MLPVGELALTSSWDCTWLIRTGIKEAMWAGDRWRCGRVMQLICGPVLLGQFGPVRRRSVTRCSGPDGPDDVDGTSSGRVGLPAHVGETGGPALYREGLSLLIRPPVAGESGGPGTDLALDDEEPAARCEYPPRLGETCHDVPPVVHGRDRPQNGCGPIRLR